MGDALFVHGGVTDAQEARLALAGLIAAQGATLLDVRTGVMHGPGSTALVTGTSSTAPMQVSVAPHNWLTSRGTSNGPYLGALAAAQLVNIGAAPGSGTRVDTVWVKQQDNTPGVPTPDGVAPSPLYGVTPGTPTKQPIPVGAEELATVAVSAGATRTTDGTVLITNTARQTVPRGGRVPVRNQAEEDALTQFPNLRIHRLDTGQQKVSNGTSFAVSYDPAFSVLTAPRGRVASLSASTVGPAAVSATETMFDAVTFTAVAGRRYKVTWDGSWIANTALVTAAFTVRSKAGATVDNAGALAHSRTVRSMAFGEFLDKLLVTEITGLAAGQTTIGIGVKVAVGAGTISIPGAADNMRKMIVEDIGA